MRRERLTGYLLLAVFFLIMFSGVINPRLLFAYEVVSVKRRGELVGKVKFDGEIPSNPSHPDLINADFCGSIVQEETFLVNQTNRGLKNVVIVIENVRRGKPPAFDSIVIENKKCRFVPHVQATTVGDSYEIRTLDPILHNIHLSMETLTLLNVAMPPGGKAIRKPISQAGLIKVKCDTHKFMQGWVFVADSPYFAVTDKNGNYSIKDIPIGDYRVKIWHEGLPGKEERVTILPNETTRLSLDLTR